MGQICSPWYQSVLSITFARLILSVNLASPDVFCDFAAYCREVDASEHDVGLVVLQTGPAVAAAKHLGWAANGAAPTKPRYLILPPAIDMLASAMDCNLPQWHKMKSTPPRACLQTQQEL
jgi:hypothetical protein